MYVLLADTFRLAIILLGDQFFFGVALAWPMRV